MKAGTYSTLRRIASLATPCISPGKPIFLPDPHADDEHQGTIGFTPVKWFALAVLLLMTGCLADHEMAWRSHRYLMAHDARFDARLVEAMLDPDGPRRQACRIETVFQTYKAQTCFWKDDQGRFDFIYHRPLPLAAGGMSGRNSAYFAESALGCRLRKVTADKMVTYSTSACD